MKFLDSTKNFLGIQDASAFSYESAKVVVQLLPYEHTSSYRLGSEAGPEAILEASHYVEYYDEELELETYKQLGIATQTPLSFSNKVDLDAMKLIEANTLKHLSLGKFIVSLGSEHTVSFGIVKAIKQRYQNVSVLQIDAHSDLRDEYEGNVFSHACVMARVHELDIPITQVGIRAQCIEEADLIKRSPSIQTFYDHQVDQLNDLEAQINTHLTDEVYITIDADGIDPAVVPGVGTPEPGGLSYHRLLRLLKDICTNKKIIGFDIVECAPIDGQIQSQYVLAKLAYKILGYCTLNPENFKSLK